MLTRGMTLKVLDPPFIGLPFVVNVLKRVSAQVAHRVNPPLLPHCQKVIVALLLLSGASRAASTILLPWRPRHNSDTLYASPRYLNALTIRCGFDTVQPDAFLTVLYYRAQIQHDLLSYECVGIKFVWHSTENLA